MSGKAQANYQALVAEYALLIAKDRIGELRVEVGEGLGLRFSWLDHGDMNRVIGVAGPYRATALADKERDGVARIMAYSRLQRPWCDLVQTANPGRGEELVDGGSREGSSSTRSDALRRAA